MNETLRETYDRNLKKYIRLKQRENGDFYLTVVGNQQNKDIKCLEKPIFSHIRVTSECNLNCPYCYTNDCITKVDMTDEEMYQLIDICDNKGVMNITWTGGEPFTRKSILEFIMYAYRLKISQTVLTNGTLLNEETINQLPKDNFTLQISLNEIWNYDDKVVKQNEVILANAKLACELGVYIVITVIFEPVSITEYEKLIKKLIEYNIQAVRFGFEVPVGGLNKKNMYVYIEKMRDMYKELNALREKYIKEIKIIYQFDKYCVNNNVLPNRFMSCEAGTTQIYIDNNGDVYPCPLFKSYDEFLCGSIKKNSWEELWESEPMKKFRDVELCSGCNVLCTDWCRALLYPITNSLEGKSLYCNKRGKNDVFEL